MNAKLKKFREIHTQLLYSLEETGVLDNSLLMPLMSVVKVPKKTMLTLIESAKRIFDYAPEVDLLLDEISEEYSVDRIAKVDLAILRVVLYEVNVEQLPVEIAVVEAIRLAEKFSSYGSSKYLHAMIDSVYNKKSDEQKCLLS